MARQAKFKAGDVVQHKLGLKAVVHAVLIERAVEGMIQELEQAAYIIGYLNKAGEVALLQVNDCVLEDYVA